MEFTSRSRLVLIGFIFGFYHIFCISMDNQDLLAENSLLKPCIQKNKKRKRDIEWNAKYMTAEGKLVVTLKAPLFIYQKICYKESRNPEEPTNEQVTFLEKFKNKNLPYTLDEDEKKIFDSLPYQHWFVIEKTDMGWEVNERPCLPEQTIPWP